MTVEMMIQELSSYPKDLQVCDTNGSPILWTSPRENKGIVLFESIADTDLKTELKAFIEHLEDDNLNDADALQEVVDNGYTLEDLRRYDFGFYKWAVRASKEYAIEIPSKHYSRF